MSEKLQDAERKEESPLDDGTLEQVFEDRERADDVTVDSKNADKDKDKSIEKRIMDSTDRVTEDFRRGSGIPQMKILVRVLLCGLFMCSAFIFFAGIMKYDLLMDQKKEIQEEIDKNNGQIEELEYLIDSPVDYDYVVRIAKEKLNLYFPDEIIYYNDYRK